MLGAVWSVACAVAILLLWDDVARAMQVVGVVDVVLALAGVSGMWRGVKIVPPKPGLSLLSGLVARARAGLSLLLGLAALKAAKTTDETVTGSYYAWRCFIIVLFPLQVAGDIVVLHKKLTFVLAMLLDIQGLDAGRTIWLMCSREIRFFVVARLFDVYATVVARSHHHLTVQRAKTEVPLPTTREATAPPQPAVVPRKFLWAMNLTVGIKVLGALDALVATVAGFRTAVAARVIYATFKAGVHGIVVEKSKEFLKLRSRDQGKLAERLNVTKVPEALLKVPEFHSWCVEWIPVLFSLLVVYGFVAVMSLVPLHFGMTAAAAFRAADYKQDPLPRQDLVAARRYYKTKCVHVLLSIALALVELPRRHAAAVAVPGVYAVLICRSYYLALASRKIKIP